MKKYKITSIPQSLPKAQTGLFNFLRKPENKKNTYWNGERYVTRSPINLKKKRQKHGSKQKDLDPNYGKTDYKGGNLEYNFADAFRNNIFGVDNDENPYPNFDKFDTYGRMRRLTNLRLNDIEQQEKQEWYQQEDKRAYKYYEDFAKSKKSDKIEPLYKNKTYTQEQVNEIKNNGNYYIQKNSDDTYSAWPYEMLENKIINNGFKDRDFVNKWGLDGEQVREQMGELIDWREEAYDNSMMNKIYNTALEENKTPEQVINELSSKDGVTENMQSHFKELVSKGIGDEYDKFVSQAMKKYDTEAWKKKKEYESNEDNFNFGKVSGWETIDGKEIWRIAADEDKKYYDWWVNQGKTPEEKTERRKQLDETERKKYTPSEESIKKDIKSRSDNYDASVAYRAGEMEKQMNHQGNDAFRQMNDYFFDQGQYTSDYQGEDIKAQKLNDPENKQNLTGYVDAVQQYMDNKVYGLDIKKRKILESQFNNPDLTEADKINILFNLMNEKDNPFTTVEGTNIGDLTGMGKNNFEPTSLEYQNWNDLYANSTYNSQLNDLYSYENLNNHRWNLNKYGKKNLEWQKQNRTWYSDLWDVVTNPGDAIGYAMDLRPNATMWSGTGGKTYNESQEYNKNRGRENEDGSITMFSDRDTHSVNPVSMMANMYNTVNPLKWTDKLSRDFSLDTVSELGTDAALAMATIYSGGLAKVPGGLNGLRALNKYNKYNKFNKFTTGAGKVWNKIDNFSKPTWNTWNKGMSTSKNLMNNYKNALKSPLRWSARRLDDARTFGQIASMPFRAIPNYTKNWMRDSWKYDKPFFMYETVKPDGYAHNLIKKAYDSDGGGFNFDDGTNAIATVSMINPALKGLSKGFQLGKGIGRGLKYGQVSIINPKTNYSFIAGNPSTSKGFFYGNPETLPNKFNNHFTKSSENLMGNIEKSESLIPKSRDKIFNKTGYGIDLRRHKRGKKRYDLGGIVVSLSQKEIDQYAKEGWIIEDV